MRTTQAVQRHPVIAESLLKRFGERTLWSNVNFAVYPGQLMAITGASGSGKSTMLNCVGLLESVDGGTINVAGESLWQMSRSSKRRLYREELGFLFQNYGLVDSWTVLQNVQLAHADSPLNAGDKRRMVETALQRMNLVGMQQTKVYQLSGGEQQRVALARLFLKRPNVILADEPTGSLDPVNAEIVMSSLRECAERGAVVLVSTHDERVVQRCDLKLAL